MKKAKSLFLFAIIAAMFSSLLVGRSFKGNAPVELEAAETDLAPRGGYSGSIFYVNGNNTYFKAGEADLAVYFFNSESDNAWGDKVSYRCFSDVLRVMIAYKDGQAKQWSNLIITRYNPNMNPATDGWNGVIDQTNDIKFSSLLYYQNTFTITGKNDGKLQYGVYSSKYYGVPAEQHMYLDLSAFPNWEEGNAKFAIYFGCPNSTNESNWSQSYYGGYHAAFCWKVEGQDNPHLYECVVPFIGQPGSGTIWNLVIAVRINPEAVMPNWDQKWNQTQDLSYSSLNSNANMIRITDWNQGLLDTENIISKEDRLGFYGQYFLDTVSCSGTGLTDSTTLAQWQAVKDQYMNMSRTYQGDIWTTQSDEDGSLIAKAMARYDYIVLFKQYNHEDFINRAESPNKTVFPTELMGFVANSKTPNTMMYIILVVALLIPTITIPVIIILKKRFH